VALLDGLGLLAGLPHLKQCQLILTATAAVTAAAAAAAATAAAAVAAAAAAVVGAGFVGNPPWQVSVELYQELLLPAGALLMKIPCAQPSSNAIILSAALPCLFGRKLRVQLWQLPVE
jgi:hypothetical protein